MQASADAPDNFDARLRQRATMADNNTLEMKPIVVPNASARAPGSGKIPNTPLSVSTISFLLGILFSGGMVMFLSGGIQQHWWTTAQLGFFLAAWSAFHWGEFAVTAGWNREKCSVDSFLLENGVQYHLAHSTALVEYLLTLYFAPTFKTHTYITAAGIVLVLIGQILRSAAMIHASTNFSHTVAFRKLDTHTLVTDGVYSMFRHPSYAGFFYWALGTQLVLQNPLSFVVFIVVLWRFFNSRIKAEEHALIRFFGQSYTQYRSRVGTKIPFIP
ncbi:ICMT-domain-containing protein [Cristinia sonorae]|uniref:Protein-S-isoprenylcysteine O-methyltransferase n=1 Tax=Cristinia sonorae TaxID=1940300 RepID=A0A8K0UWU0_9AGAR|nr:ICMT-domain-containing protein [Cristinia sonorae]